MRKRTRKRTRKTRTKRKTAGRTRHSTTPPSALDTRTHANFIGYPAFGRAAPGQLFWHDEAGHRIAGQGRSFLFYRRLSLDDVAVRCRGAAPQRPGCRLGFFGLRAGPKEINFLSAIGCPRSD